MNDNACRIDIWLWRARFVKTRGLAAGLVERGAVRLTHQGRETRLDKAQPMRYVGDLLTFAQNGHVTSLKVEGLGERRGPAEEAAPCIRLRYKCLK